MSLLIKNGRVVNADGSFYADVLMRDGKIASLGQDISAPDAQTIDASGCYVLPGFIDTHTHFDLDLGTMVTADDFITGSKAAILGGTTTVLDFATQTREGTLGEALSQWHGKAKGASCNYGFHMAIARWDDGVAAELKAMKEAGVASYKMYLVYDALRVDDGSLYSALKAIKEQNALLGVHCENWDALVRIADEVKAMGITSPKGHPLSRPPQIEAEAVARYMRIAQLANAPAYVVHLSTAEGLEEALRARRRGQEVYLETCPQYLLLSDERYEQSDGAKFVMSPPLRKKADNEALMNACACGDIDAVGTDHCSFTMAQKDVGKDDFTKTPNGGAGVRWRGELLYTYGVLANKLSMERFVALMSYNASRLFGMENRGAILPGYAADAVIWDGEATRRISDADGEHNCDNSPFDGFEVKGRALHVALNGELAVRCGELVSPGRGRYIRRAGMTSLR